MSKKRVDRRLSERVATKAEAKKNIDAPNAGRRKFILLGATAAAGAGVAAAAAYNAGWFDSKSAEPVMASSNSSAPKPAGKVLAPVQLTADYPNALRAVNEMLEFYARDIANPSVLIHAVRGFGRNFTMSDGRNAVDHLCSTYAAEREVGGKRYVYFKRDAEVHENSFLKTFLEAGVNQDQSITVGGGDKYTLRDLGQSGEALFRCDPKDLYKYDARQFRYDDSYAPPKQTASGQTSDTHGEFIHEHLPWGLIAFSILNKPDQGHWTNAFGETIDLGAVASSALNEYENTCELGEQQLERGEAAPKDFREEIKKYSCFGMHSVYGFLSCVNHGYRNDKMAERVKQIMDILTFRLKGDAEAIDQDYAQEAQGQPPMIVDAFVHRAKIKLLGHAFESINYAKLHNLVAFTPAQEQRIQAGEQALYDSLIKMRAMDWGVLNKAIFGLTRTPGQGDKFLSDIVIALGHAARAMKLLTPQNPDVLA